MTYEVTLIAPYQSGLSKYYKPFLIGNDAFVDLVNAYSQRGTIKKREGSTILARLPKWATSTGITNASPPVVTAASHGLSTGDMVWLENVLTTNGTISSVTSGQPTVITTTGAHGMSAGQTVVISGVVGINRVDGLPFNNQVYQILSVGANTLNLNLSTTGTYVSGGSVFLGNLEKKAFKITVLSANTFSLQDLNSGLNVAASGVAQSADIYLPVVGTRTFIITSSGNEQLIVFNPKKAYLYNTSTMVFDNISFDTSTAAISWTGTKDNFFYTSNYATVMWTTNNVDNIRYFNGSLTAGWVNFTPIVSGATTMTQGLIVLPYKGRLVVLNTIEGGTNFSQRARWSQIGTPFIANAPSGYSTDVTAWRSDIPGKGGFIDADTSERIMSAAIIQDTLIVGFQFSTWRLRYTGNEILPFIWERISTQFGSECTFADVPFDDKKLQISRRGIVGASFNDVSRIDLVVPDYVDSFETGMLGEGLNRIQGIRDYQKRLVYWIYGDEASNDQTPNKVLCYNYQDDTWATFDQSFTTLGAYKRTSDNTWSTWGSIWDGDTSTWNTPLDQTNTIIIVAGAKDSNVWIMMNSEVSTDNGVNFNFTITTNLINPYFKQGRRCRLAFYDLYITNTDHGEITIENYTDDNPSEPWLIKKIPTNALTKTAKYFRVFLGMIARNHQIKLTLSPAQLNDSNVGASDFELQGILFHTRIEGRIKQ